VPVTGQTNVYQTGDDGYYQKGVTNPVPRFVALDESDQIRDNLTGLIWAKDANINGTKNWSAAITYCESLVYGGTNDWRLPNIRELSSLVDYANNNPALPTGHPFSNVQSFYWSSTTCSFNYFGNVNAWYVYLYYGDPHYDNVKVGLLSVWPVRGGQ
jgi:hypothetical protein